MPAPAIPPNFYVQQGDSQVFLSWDIVAGATSYSVYRSTDGVSYSSLSAPAVNNYLDASIAVNTLYYYKVASVNGSGTGEFTVPQSIIPTLPGKISLGELRLRSQEAADRVGSKFLTLPEWNYNINKSALELYDILITVYEDYYIAPRLSFQTDGTQLYDLPNGSNYSGAKAFYKLYGVDCGLDASSNAWVTLKKFDFISRNRYVYPQITSTLLGVFNMQYRLHGDKLMIIPTPSGAQHLGIWYFPRLSWMLQDTDVLDGISGWDDYIIIDAAIKALQKEESDTSVLMARKQMLMDRIESSAMNRDAGQPDTISNTRSNSETWGGYGGPGFDGSYGGW